MRANLLRGGGILSVLALILFGTAMLAYGVTEEVPVGTLTGRVIAEESKKPIKNARVTLIPFRSDLESGVPERTVRTDADGNFTIRNAVAVGYRLSCISRAHSSDAQGVIVREGQSDSVTVSMKPTGPYIELLASQHVFMPTEKPVVQIHGFAPEKSIKAQLIRVKFDAIVKAGGLSQVLSPLSYNNPKLDINTVGTVVQTVNHDIAIRDDEGIFSDDLAIPLLEEGVYWLRVDTKIETRGTYIVVSRIGLVTKIGKDRGLAYVMNLETGEPVPGAKIMRQSGTTATAIGLTDTTGSAEIAATVLKAAQNESSVWAEFGASRALTGFYRREGSESTGAGTIITDRPVYRPGDTVQFKGVFRNRGGGSLLSLPKGSAVTATIRDPDDTIIRTESLTMNRHGSVSSQFDVDEGVTGSYSVELKSGETTLSQGVVVASYRKPEFKMTVTPTQPSTVRGDTVTMRVRAEYYFGGPVPGAKLNGSVYARPRYSSIDEMDDDAYSEYESEGDYSGEFVGEVSGVTDGKGEALLEFKTQGVTQIGAYDDYDLTFKINGTEAGEKYFDSEGTAIVTLGAFQLSAYTDQYLVEAGKTFAVKIKTKTQGTNKPLGGQILEVVSGPSDWDGKTAIFKKEATQSVTTDADGNADVNLVAKNPGEIRIEVSGKDSQGRLVSSESSIYVAAAGEYTFSSPDPDLQIVLNQRTFREGETVTGLIRTDKPGGTALVTVESQNVEHRQVVQLKNRATTVKLPAAVAWDTEAVVKVAYVQKKRFTEAQRNIKLSRPERNMTVTVTPANAVEKPGGSSRYRILAIDQAGKPVSTELALAVVDESIFAIRKDKTNLINDLYPKRYSGVSTSFSFPDVYLGDGDKSAVAIQIRQNFKDTAAWMPTVETDAKGEAEVNVLLPDNLTGWRATAYAVSDEGLAGMGRGDIVVRKDLMVRLSVPSMITEGDELQISATANNGLDSTQDVKLELEVDGATVSEATNASFTLSPDKPETARWTLKPSRLGDISLTVKGVSSQASDGMKSTIHVVPLGRPDVVAGSGRISGPSSDPELKSTPATVEIPIVRDPKAGTGALTLQLQPGLTAVIVDALPSLIDYPYGCIEQTLSKMVPAVAARELFRVKQMQTPNFLDKADEIIRRGMFRVRQLQTSDGHWGWWEHDNGNMRMTGLALDGLADLRGLKVKVPDPLVERAVEWALKAEIPKGKDKDWQWDEFLSLLAGASRFNTNAVLGDKAAQLPESVKGLLPRLNQALIFHRLGRVNDRDRAWGLVQDRVQESNSTALWASDYGWDRTGLVLRAMLEIAPDSPLVAKAVQGLIETRKGNRWSQTWHTHEALIPLMQVAARSNETAGPVTYRVTLNGKTIREATIAPTDLRAGVTTIKVPFEQIDKGDNKLRIEANAPGAIYAYSFEQTVSRPSLEPVIDPGIGNVTMTYHRLEARAYEDGSLRLLPSKAAMSDFVSGDVLLAKIAVKPTRALSFTLLEVPIPTGFRVAEDSDPETWSYWWTGMTILDDRIAMFVSSLDTKPQEFEFKLRAETPGAMTALPATFSEMYAPDKRSSSASMKLRIAAK